MGFKKWIGDIIGRIISNILTGLAFVLIIFFGMKLLIKWIGL